MMSFVYHCKDSRGKCRHFPRDFELVAAVRATKLEQVLDLTHSIDKHWSTNKKVKVFKEVFRNSRSTTVGDVVVTPQGVFRLGFDGWESISFPLPAQPAKV